MSSGQSKNNKRGEEPVSAVRHQMAPHCLVSFTIKPGIIFRKLFLKLFVRFRHQWLLQQKQLKNPCDLQQAAHSSFLVVLLTSNPAPHFSSQGAPEVEICWKLLCLSLEMSKAGPSKKEILLIHFNLLKRLLKRSPFWFWFTISEIFWSTFYWEMLSPATRSVTPQGRCGYRKIKCCVLTRGKAETSLCAQREGGGGEGGGDPGPRAGVIQQPLHGLTTAPFSILPTWLTLTMRQAGVSVKVRLGESSGGVLILSLFLTIQIYFKDQ